jgi:hypothetical protein
MFIFVHKTLNYSQLQSINVLFMKKLITSIMLLGLMCIANAQNAAPQATTATAGTLTVTFSTSSTSTYALAIYITNSSGALVNTMLYRTGNGDSSAKDMSTFWSTIGSSWSTSATKLLTNSDLDATSGATATSGYTSKILYWGKKTAISTVVDGSYTVNLEMANYSPVNRRYTSGVFTKGPAAQTVNITTVTGFTAATLTWTPVAAGIENVEFSKLYSVYPNPAISSIYASGNDIKEVQICSLAGKILLTSKLQNVNVSALPKGAYLAVIYAKDGMVVKKIEKL